MPAASRRATRKGAASQKADATERASEDSEVHAPCICGIRQAAIVLRAVFTPWRGSFCSDLCVVWDPRARWPRDFRACADQQGGSCVCACQQPRGVPTSPMRQAPNDASAMSCALSPQPVRSGLWRAPPCRLALVSVCPLVAPPVTSHPTAHACTHA